MRFSRQCTAAALLAVCAAVSTIQSALAAEPGSPGAAAPGAAAPDAAVAPGPDAGHPDDGPRRHGFGPAGPGAPGPAMPFGHGPSGLGLFGHGLSGHGPFGDSAFGGGPFGPLRHLDLSEAQQDKLFAIMHAAEPQRRDQMKAVRKAEESLRGLGAEPRFDEARANAAARELGQAIANGAVLRARIESQVLALLTPEQRERMRKHRPAGPPGMPGAGGQHLP